MNEKRYEELADRAIRAREVGLPNLDSGQSSAQALLDSDRPIKTEGLMDDLGATDFGMGEMDDIMNNNPMLGAVMENEFENITKTKFLLSLGVNDSINNEIEEIKEEEESNQSDWARDFIKNEMKTQKKVNSGMI